MSVGAIGAEILGGGGIHPPPWYTSLKHPMVLGVNKIVMTRPWFDLQKKIMSRIKTRKKVCQVVSTCILLGEGGLLVELDGGG